jgi:hypothetical protein
MVVAVAREGIEKEAFGKLEPFLIAGAVADDVLNEPVHTQRAFAYVTSEKASSRSMASSSANSALGPAKRPSATPG